MVSERVARNGAKYRLRRDVFDSLMAERDAKRVTDQVRLTGVPQRTLERIRGGGCPSFATATQISDALGVPLKALFQRDAA